MLKPGGPEYNTATNFAHRSLPRKAEALLLKCSTNGLGQAGLKMSLLDRTARSLTMTSVNEQRKRTSSPG